MTESPPQLTAIPSPGDRAAAAAEPAVPPPARRRALPWVLAAGLAGSGLGWALEAQESQELATSLEATRMALEETRGELAAWESHADVARGQARALVGDVASLAERLATLEALLAGGPGAAPPEEAPPPVE